MQTQAAIRGYRGRQSAKTHGAHRDKPLACSQRGKGSCQQTEDIGRGSSAGFTWREAGKLSKEPVRGTGLGTRSFLGSRSQDCQTVQEVPNASLTLRRPGMEFQSPTLIRCLHSTSGAGAALAP